MSKTGTMTEELKPSSPAADSTVPHTVRLPSSSSKPSSLGEDRLILRTSGRIINKDNNIIISYSWSWQT